MIKETQPNSVRIGPYRYDIVPMSNMEGRKHSILASFFALDNEIQYLDTLGEQKKASVLIHEILHGMWFASGLTDDFGDDEEEHVMRLTHQLAGFIKDNPLFVAWLSQTLADEDTNHVLEAVPTYVEF